jgi:hypothetical protein
MPIGTEWFDYEPDKIKEQIVKEMYKRYSEYLGEIMYVTNNYPYIFRDNDIIMFNRKKPFERGMDVFKIHGVEIKFGVTCNGEYFCDVPPGFIKCFRELWEAQEQKEKEKVNDFTKFHNELQEHINTHTIMHVHEEILENKQLFMDHGGFDSEMIEKIETKLINNIKMILLSTDRFSLNYYRNKILLEQICKLESPTYEQIWSIKNNLGVNNE